VCAHNHTIELKEVTRVHNHTHNPTTELKKDLVGVAQQTVAAITELRQSVAGLRRRGVRGSGARGGEGEAPRGRWQHARGARGRGRVRGREGRGEEALRSRGNARGEEEREDKWARLKV
jgi:hypothetical protein